MEQSRDLRIAVAVSGVMLMAGCAIVAITLTEWIAEWWPDGYLLGRGWLLYCFAPLTMISTAAAAVLWTRRLQASAVEGAAALFLAEPLAWSVVAHYYGAWYNVFVFAFWIAANFLFAPWWVLGVWLGLVIDRREQGSDESFHSL